jgi:hypothetical protein
MSPCASPPLPGVIEDLEIESLHGDRQSRGGFFMVVALIIDQPEKNFKIYKKNLKIFI